MADIATVAQELAAEKATAGAPSSAPAEDAAPAEAATLLGVLDADQRIRANAEQNERTLWVSAVFVTLLYAAIVAAQAHQLLGIRGRAALEEAPFETGAERLGMLELAVEQDDLLAGRGELVVE